MLVPAVTLVWYASPILRFSHEPSSLHALYEFPKGNPSWQWATVQQDKPREGWNTAKRVKTVTTVKTVCENCRETNENCENGEFIYVNNPPPLLR